MSYKHEFVKSKDYPKACAVCEYIKKNPIHNPNPTEKRDSVIQKKKIMLHKTKEYATGVIPATTVESWREEFRKEFEFIGHKGVQCDEITVTNLLAFISSQIQQSEERLVEELYDITQDVSQKPEEMLGRLIARIDRIKEEK